MDNKLSELSKPVRTHRDWNRASMCHCGKCDRWEMTIADADGVQTCASCYDAEWLSEWQDYAEAAEKRIAELEDGAGSLIYARPLIDMKSARVNELRGLLAHNIERAEKAEKLLANREVQPVGYAENGKGFIYPPERQDRIKNPVAVYTTPPALPVQHWEDLCRQNPNMSIGDAIIRAAWWNHCRAELLKSATPPDSAPANAQAVAWEMRYWSDGYNIWGDWERITAEQHAEMSVKFATDNDYEFRILYDAPPAPAVPEEMKRDPDADVFDPGFMDGWNACRAAMLKGGKS
ncbi:hypothetical protein [Serratia marcescens]|uniref:hypothetical protein n=1 Tax=Serratia marcescens TaxID=615 RepID=UPI0007454B06|nr:hypothetical protein [Serratia marcescens]CUY07984.1 Uncharacterised protein [Serratia marcescens]CUY22109.1 Uncharacterised protein [Serratia marcescens]CUY56051.1 Uncharacterised protein [Serratia marcescens]CUZ39665.1 Uncharacterised protein [Serratia marcescens]CVA83394.1 Uncharacterised protein [Serratia marcescens]